MNPRRGKRFAILAALTVVFTGLTSAAVSIDASTPSGDNIDNFDITVQGDGVTVNRDNVDLFERSLEDGEYTVRIRKEGYSDVERDILVEEEEEAEYIFSMVRDEEDAEESDIEITRVSSPEIICRGQSFSVDFDIKNNADSAKVVSTSGSGFGEILSGKSFVVQPDQTRTYRFIFTDVRGTGDKEFRVSAISKESASATGSVTIDNCGGFSDPASVDNIDVNLYPVEGRDKAAVGELVRVKGFADGARGSVELNMSVNGENLNKVQTLRDGYFQTFFRPESSGMKTVTVSTQEVEDSESLEVVPKPEIGELESKSEVFEGEEFEICGNVDSSIVPEIVLMENGDVIETRQDRGEVCFEVEAPEAGDYNYEMRVLTYGNDDSSMKEVMVLEQGPEAKSFPEQVSSVETEDSLVRVGLYNTNDGIRNYTVRLEDVPSGWAPEQVKNVSLNKGEKESVYFYLSPGEKGEASASLIVESEGEEVYQDDLSIFSTGSPPSERTVGEIYGIVLDFLKTIF